MNLESEIFNQKVEQFSKGPGTRSKDWYKNKIIRYFPETHLGNGHDGLAKIAKKHNITVKDLEQGEFVIFVNKKQTALKMFAPGNVVAHLKVPGNQRLNPKVIVMIPRFFNGTDIDYTGSLKEVLTKEFK